MLSCYAACQDHFAVKHENGTITLSSGLSLSPRGRSLLIPVEELMGDDAEVAAFSDYVWDITQFVKGHRQGRSA